MIAKHLLFVTLKVLTLGKFSPLIDRNSTDEWYRHLSYYIVREYSF